MQGKGLEHFLSKDQINNDTGISVHDKYVVDESPLHWHNFLEIELVLDGEGEQTLNGHSTALKRGSFSVMRLTDFHKVTPKGKLHLLNLKVDDRLLNEEMLLKITAGQTMYFNLTEQEVTVFESLFNLCMEENQSQTPDRRYLKHLLFCIFLRILRLAPVTAKSTDDERPIQTALLYLHIHFRENPTLKDVAKIAHYNTSHFSATFHKELGMTYCEYLNMLKISYAKELLISTNLKISEVCSRSGFTSHSNFLRLFNERLGMSPIKYRQRAIDKHSKKPV